MRGEFEKNSPEFQMVGEIWKILKENFITETKDEYWETLIKQVDDYAKKYEHEKSHELATGLGMALLAFLEKKSKKEHEQYKPKNTTNEKLWLAVISAYADFLEVADETDKKLLEEEIAKYSSKKESAILNKVVKEHWVKVYVKYSTEYPYLPEAIADSKKELAIMINRNVNSVYSAFCHKQSTFAEVDIGEEKNE